MDAKEQLKDLIDAVVNKNGESAQVTFHNYLQGKMQDILQTDIKVDTPEANAPAELETKE